MSDIEENESNPRDKALIDAALKGLVAAGFWDEMGIAERSHAIIRTIILCVFSSWSDYIDEMSKEVAAIEHAIQLDRVQRFLGEKS